MNRVVQILKEWQRGRVSAAVWPKQLPVLTSEQQAIREDFMRYWLEVLPKSYGLIEQINHRYALARHPTGQCKTLEVGAGSGAHLAYEDLTLQEYTALELREELGCQISLKYPQVHVVIGDVEKRIEAPDRWFDRVIAIHVWELLDELGRHFHITEKSYWPLRIPSVHLNLVIGLTCVL